MNCAEARTAMMRCELAALAPQAVGTLAEHIRQCDDCRASADVILTRTAGLRHAIDARKQPSRRRHALRRRGVAGALTIAAGILAVAAIARRVSPGSTANSPQETPRHSPITIENAQGRAVTVVERRDTIDVIFHARESQ